ncbi:DUF1194 domain-containing protein [Rhizobium ruizarguesonis]|jgi:hypothetical protein|uniref:DUF1194 domain-containing protein n=1 Tax=Rhizobium ruizarguesonis TaxID=2081791 RepID=A0AB38I2T6_9HYPH|nr:DUF1194 domain-containing protein [Rhizobium ruizarguesonis]TCA27488.1 DUF1194 domain-containing protein [Rhizobium leguminosarum bv. viciae]NEI04929.1 DUF1194 domain-containing protein [Rhizobium ruizarguesonis]NEI28868.1 DUF1194 domain-containing protein [Rhizobium ruizarguesonis]TAY94733.1 DUF1194 domain-containing protein [Rhizobium ruizarguesonis]TAZ79137.1 DUF1194 domain-containing protein [Rhizobium ruizarguesonis]
MLTTLAVLMSLSGLVPIAQAGGSDVDVALVLAVDTSRSMDFEEIGIQREGYVEALKHKEFIDAVKDGLTGRIAISYFEWAGYVVQDSVIDWQVIETEEDAIAFAGKLEARPIATQRRTSISTAIAQGASMIVSSPFRSRRQVIDVSGDGPNNSGDPVTPARDKAVEAGMIINGLAIMLRPSDAPNGLDKYYADCVIGGPGAFVLPVRKIEDFAVAVRRKLVLEISGLSPPVMVQKIAGAEAGTDCMIGEKQWRDIFDR